MRLYSTGASVWNRRRVLVLLQRETYDYRWDMLSSLLVPASIHVLQDTRIHLYMVIVPGSKGT